MAQRSGNETGRRVSPVSQRSGDTGTPDLNGAAMRNATSGGRARSSLSRDRCGPRASAQVKRPPLSRCVTDSGGRNPALGPAGNRGAKNRTPVQGVRSEGLGGGVRGGGVSAWGRRCATSPGRALHRLGVKGLAPLNNPPWASRGRAQYPTSPLAEILAALLPDRAPCPE